MRAWLIALLERWLFAPGEVPTVMHDDDGGGLYNPDGWGCLPGKDDLLASYAAERAVTY